MKPTEAEAIAIVRLSALPEWEHVMGMIGKHAEKLNKALIMNDDINADIKRGELRTAVLLTDAFVAAPSLVESYNQPKT